MNQAYGRHAYLGLTLCYPLLCMLPEAAKHSPLSRGQARLSTLDKRMAASRGKDRRAACSRPRLAAERTVQLIVIGLQPKARRAADSLSHQAAA
jgi:hypothetical protein